MDMIERVAKAIMRADTEGNPRFDYEEWIGKGWRHYASQARAAIAAMREPTDEMVRQCMDTGHTRDDACGSCADAEAAWQAMAEAALQLYESTGKQSYLEDAKKWVATLDAALNETKSTTKGEVA